MNVPGAVRAMFEPPGLVFLLVVLATVGLSAAVLAHGHRSYHRFFGIIRTLRRVIKDMPSDGSARQRLRLNSTLDIEELQRALAHTPAAIVVSDFAAFIARAPIIERGARALTLFGATVSVFALMASASAPAPSWAALAPALAPALWGLVGSMVLMLLAERNRRVIERASRLVRAAVFDTLNNDEDLEETVTGDGSVADFLEEPSKIPREPRRMRGRRERRKPRTFA